MSEHEALTAALDELDRNDELIAHHQLQVVSLEEMLEESEQARKLEVDAANHVIKELRRDNSRLREAIDDIANMWKCTNDYEEYLNNIHEVVKRVEVTK